MTDARGALGAAGTSLECRITAGRPGDHHLACRLLSHLQQAPSAAEFQAQLDDPFYEPSDRLLAHLQNRVVGHVRLVHRELRFGATDLAITGLADLMILPEHRGQGCGAQLLAAAEQESIAADAVLGLTRTNAPAFFLRRGWCVWSRHSYSTAGAREILARLLEASASPQDAKPHEAVTVRWWRHIETPGLMRLYQEHTRRSFGALQRSEAYWEWLLARRAFDRIYVAVQGPDRLEFDDGASAIVGYAVMKQGRILELIASPDAPGTAEKLLARICADSIEQDGHYIRLEAPVGDPLHHVMARAGGELGYHEAVHGEVCLIKLLNLSRLLEKLAEQIQERAREAHLLLPVELTLNVEGQRYALEVRPRTVRFRPLRSGRCQVTCGRSELTQLLLGHLDLKVAIAGGRVSVSGRTVAEILATLFPVLPLWRPPWDELSAR